MRRPQWGSLYARRLLIVKLVALLDCQTLLRFRVELVSESQTLKPVAALQVYPP